MAAAIVTNGYLLHCTVIDTSYQYCGDTCAATCQHKRTAKSAVLKPEDHHLISDHTAETHNFRHQTLQKTASII